MSRPKVIVFTGYGINCEMEATYGFTMVGATAEFVHINDVIDGYKNLKNYQIMVIPGGFAYGDDTGSGNAYANKMRNHLWEKIQKFIQNDKLVIGICNGFQILVNLGLLPALDGKYGDRQVGLTFNDSARYTNRWVDLKVASTSPWLKGIKEFSAPVAHGEGKFYAPKETLSQLNRKKMIALKYIKGEICNYQHLEPNPNGSLEDIAGITDETGRIFGLMPHPDRALFFTQLPHWTYLKEKYKREGKRIPKEGPGLQIFKNGVRYFH